MLCLSNSERAEAVLKSLDKAYTGEMCTVKDWDIKVIPSSVRSILKKYGLEKSYDPDNPCNTDMELADTFYKAGYELALELGFLCEDTERIIKVEESEMQEAFDQQPNMLRMGGGDDAVFMTPRKPEDEALPVMIAPLALMMSEEYVVPVLAGIAKHRGLIDVLNGLTIDKPKGRDIRSGTPYETWLGHYEQELKRQALWMAGREEMGTLGVSNSTTEYGFFGGAESAPGNNPQALCLLPAELKICFGNFHRVLHAINLGYSVHAGSNSYIGGYAGPVEGAAVANIANELLLTAILRADNTGNNIFDMKHLCGTSRKALWGNSVVTQAISRNTKIMNCKILDTVGGPCTEFYFYESAAGLMINAASGASCTIGPRSAGGRLKDYITPVEAWWCGEVFKSCGNMKLEEVNEIAKKLIPKYEADLGNPPIGKSISECFDLKRLEPTEEYRELYNRMRKEISDLGLPLDRVHSM